MPSLQAVATKPSYSPASPAATLIAHVGSSKQKAPLAGDGRSTGTQRACISWFPVQPQSKGVSGSVRFPSIEAGKALCAIYWTEILRLLLSSPPPFAVLAVEWQLELALRCPLSQSPPSMPCLGLLADSLDES